MPEKLMNFWNQKYANQIEVAKADKKDSRIIAADKDEKCQQN